MAKELTTESYIDHHLTNLTCGHVGMDESAGIYKSFWTCDPYMVDKMGFWAFHVDSLFWSVFYFRNYRFKLIFGVVINNNLA